MGFKKLPRKLVILGGGPIGSEMAQAFSRLGSEVTVVEMSSQIMSREDNDVVQFVKERFKKITKKTSCIRWWSYWI